MPSEKPFLGFNIDPELLRHIDDFRFNNRYSSRSKAMEFIIRAGMDALAAEYPELDLSIKLETGKKAKGDGVKGEERVHL